MSSAVRLFFEDDDGNIVEVKSGDPLPVVIE